MTLTTPETASVADAVKVTELFVVTSPLLGAVNVTTGPVKSTLREPPAGVELPTWSVAEWDTCCAAPSVDIVTGAFDCDSRQWSGQLPSSASERREFTRAGAYGRKYRRVIGGHSNYAGVTGLPSGRFN